MIRKFIAKSIEKKAPSLGLFSFTVDFRLLLFLAAAGGHIEDDSGGEDSAADDVLEGNIGTKEVHAVHEGHVDKSPDEGAGDFANASSGRDATDIGGGDGIHLEKLAGLGCGRLEPGGEEDA